MNQANTQHRNLNEAARELRRQAMSELIDATIARIGAALRTRHESTLHRGVAHTPRRKSVRGTPA